MFHPPHLHPQTFKPLLDHYKPSSQIPLMVRRIRLLGKWTQDFVPYVRLVHFQGWTRGEIPNEGWDLLLWFVHFQGCTRKGEKNLNQLVFPLINLISCKVFFTPSLDNSAKQIKWSMTISFLMTFQSLINVYNTFLILQPWNCTNHKSASHPSFGISPLVQPWKCTSLT